MDTEKLGAALDEKLYLPRLQKTTRDARTMRINSAPTFVIDGYGKITGAQSIGAFRKALQQVVNGSQKAAPLIVG